MILNEVEALIAQARAVAKRYEAIVPEPIRQEHWQKTHSDPSCWETLERKYSDTPGLDGMSTLTLVIARLEGLVFREKAKGKPVDLSLGRMR